MVIIKKLYTKLNTTTSKALSQKRTHVKSKEETRRNKNKNNFSDTPWQMDF